jgi:hypothetical protein
MQIRVEAVVEALVVAVVPQIDLQMVAAQVVQEL